MIEHPDECSEDENFCGLGLKTLEEFEYDMGARYYAFQSVMTEQDSQQRRRQNYDHDQIAEAYICITCHQQVVAEKRAAALAAELQPGGLIKSSATQILEALQEWGFGP